MEPFRPSDLALIYYYEDIRQVVQQIIQHIKKNSSMKMGGSYPHNLKTNLGLLVQTFLHEL